MDSNHSVTEYNRLVASKLASCDEKEAMAESIGGNFSHFGLFQRALLLQLGLPVDGHLLDVGCGSGRLALALRDLHQLRYTGIDVVPSLLEYAAARCDNPAWRFLEADGFHIPLDDDSVDMAVAFSVFTHLLHEESYAYLAEMRRVLKPGGIIVFSYLEFDVPAHWSVFASNLAHLDDRIHLNQFIANSMIEAWTRRLRLETVAIHRGDTAYIQLTGTIEADDGQRFSGTVSLGQSLCVLRKSEYDAGRVLAVLPEDFDPQGYLTKNPDVAATGMDPGVHYLLHGQFESREW